VKIKLANLPFSRAEITRQCLKLVAELAAIEFVMANVCLIVIDGWGVSEHIKGSGTSQ